ncbi:GINS complex subunit Sld5 [Stetteria hydrogenophila]
MGLIGDRLRLIELDYEFRDVRVLFLRDYGELPLPNGKVTVRKGDELDLPRWQARLLAEQGYVEIKERPLSVDEINMLHYREKRGRGANEIQPLPPDFYLKVRDYVSMLNSAIKDNPSSMLLREREVAEKNTLDLADARLVKILRLAQSGSSEYKDRMTPEEHVAFDVIQSVIEEWRGYVRRLAAGGEG